VELSPQYVDVAIKRWQAFTGKQAQLQGTKTFDTVAQERQLDAGGDHAGTPA
jgi:DNA modification methylase